MITLIVFAYMFSLVTSGMLLLEGLATAPIGYEDDRGFQYGRPLN